ncbi:MAG TPA: DUF1801 domain-containing protein [Intrasporangium sp.]|nr:DUF1801 domain-containing protein [Intrasporangium sp.]
MAEKAGVINDRGRDHDVAFTEVIGSSPPEVQELARAVRNLVYDVLPFKQHVTLGFYHGGGLEDPAGLLRAGGGQASGKLSMRSLKLTSVDEVSRPELRDLILASTQHVVPPPHG